MPVRLPSSVPVRDVSQAQPGTPSAALLAEEQDSSDRAMLPIHMYVYIHLNHVPSKVGAITNLPQLTLII